MADNKGILTIKKIMAVTKKIRKPDIVNNSEPCYVKSYKVSKKYAKSNGLAYYDCNVKIVSPMSTQKKNKVYNVRVVAGTMDFSKAIRVSCDCHFFQYWGCADVLNLYKATFKVNVTGIMPNSRNPQYIPFVCKHAYVAFQEILERQ